MVDFSSTVACMYVFLLPVIYVCLNIQKWLYEHLHQFVMKFKYFISMVDFSSKCDMYVCFLLLVIYHLQRIIIIFKPPTRGILVIHPLFNSPLTPLLLKSNGKGI
jgi:hypothetical protein